MSNDPTGNDTATLSIVKTGGTAENIGFTDAEAWALVQFVNRVSWAEFSANAADDDEAFLIKQSVDKLQDVLARAGFIPR